ncbi:hypothetical protein PMAYCL1PPCAC_09348, partial [Pristionchus mayeri]
IMHVEYPVCPSGFFSKLITSIVITLGTLEALDKLDIIIEKISPNNQDILRCIILSPLSTGSGTRCTRH